MTNVSATDARSQQLAAEAFTLHAKLEYLWYESSALSYLEDRLLALALKAQVRFERRARAAGMRVYPDLQSW